MPTDQSRKVSSSTISTASKQTIVSKICTSCGEQTMCGSTKRWPSNVLLDEEAGKLLDEQAGVRKSGDAPRRRGSAKTKNCYGEFEGQPDCPPGRDGNSGGASRFFFCAKTSTKERNTGMLPGEVNGHATVKPISLMQWLIKLVTPPGGIILDPFLGSGSTGCAAGGLGFEFHGIELGADHLEIAKKRIAYWAGRKRG
jgi:site-specific DNA-methyltransferase (adenine-specific)